MHALLLVPERFTFYVDYTRPYDVVAFRHFLFHVLTHLFAQEMTAYTLGQYLRLGRRRSHPSRAVRHDGCSGGAHVLEAHGALAVSGRYLQVCHHD